MTAKEANKITKEREEFGLLIDAIEKEAKKGNFQLDTSYIDVGEAYYFIDDNISTWLANNGYRIYIKEDDYGFDDERTIISWA